MSNIDTFSSPQVSVRMFDADCKNMIRIPQRTAFQGRTGSLVSQGRNGSVVPAKNHVDTSVCVADVAFSNTTTQPNIIFEWSVCGMPLMYTTVTIAGLTLLGILGSAIGVMRTLLSVAIFNSLLVPVLIMHSLLSIENTQAVGFGICTVVYTGVSVPFSLVFNTHLFSSVSFGLVIVFHCVAGGWGGRCLPHILILGIFIFIDTLELPSDPDRGDTVALIVLPGIRMILVGVSGGLSTMSPMNTARSVVVM
jgi:hypothetical protein